MTSIPATTAAAADAASDALPLFDVRLPRIACFGDSITQQGFSPNQGWITTLANYWVRKAEVVNRGLSGYNAAWYRVLLPSFIHELMMDAMTGKRAANAPANPARVWFATLWLGANDAVLPAVNPKQHVPLDAFRDHLRAMVAMLQQADIPVIVITPPPPDPKRWSSRYIDSPDPDRSIDTTRQYRDACIDVANATGSLVLDTWTLFFGPEAVYDIDVCARLLSDGLHLSAEGNARVGQALLDLVLKTWPGLNADVMTTAIPWHRHVDANDLPDSLTKNLHPL
ncbi:hypothetical protein CXG81DRAFT_25368 [Caulochytrium protostelioides]|uniref:SGNH hydrolase-type esterase domain-containing protein n=1 Tax=Caulochytrium protostelioides TaxID=1555241 RepID=A0A4P9X9G3_9FUNG|nr:hypothetical protein CXG81DRAFT_25368 [Caulochytrium protostelioides]|eukprot:RKP01948.1 hypothetical protein CXG81DRAFT_25368 [Caulochytrium protostelioides]